MTKKVKHDPRRLRTPFANGIMTALFRKHPDITRVKNFQWVPGFPTEIWFEDGEETIGVDENLNVVSLHDRRKEYNSFLTPDREETELSKELHALLSTNPVTLEKPAVTRCSGDFAQNKAKVEQIFNVLAVRWHEVTELLGEPIDFLFNSKRDSVDLLVGTEMYRIVIYPEMKATAISNGVHLDKLTDILHTR